MGIAWRLARRLDGKPGCRSVARGASNQTIVPPALRRDKTVSPTREEPWDDDERLAGMPPSPRRWGVCGGFRDPPESMFPLGVLEKKFIKSLETVAFFYWCEGVDGMAGSEGMHGLLGGRPWSAPALREAQAFSRGARHDGGEGTAQRPGLADVHHGAQVPAGVRRQSGILPTPRGAPQVPRPASVRSPARGPDRTTALPQTNGARPPLRKETGPGDGEGLPSRGRHRRKPGRGPVLDALVLPVDRPPGWTRVRPTCIEVIKRRDGSADGRLGPQGKDARSGRPWRGDRRGAPGGTPSPPPSRRSGWSLAESPWAGRSPSPSGTRPPGWHAVAYEGMPSPISRDSGTA